MTEPLEQQPQPIDQTGEAYARRTLDLKRPNYLGMVLTPEYFNIDPESYDDVTPAQVAIMAPTVLAEELISPPRDSQLALTFKDDAKQDITIAVHPNEFELIVGNVASFKQRVTNKAHRAQQKQLRSASDPARAQRSAGHALQSKFDMMGTYYHNVLEPRQAMIESFLEAAENKNLSRGHEVNMRLKVASLQTYLEDDVIETVRLQQGHPPHVAPMMRRAMMKRIVLADDNVKNFEDLLDMCSKHNTLKMDLFRQRAWTIKNQLSAQ